MNELLKRAATGAVYVALTIGSAFAGPATTLLLFLPVCAIAAQELHRLLWPAQDRPPMGWSILSAVVVYLAIGLLPMTPELRVVQSLALCLLTVLVGLTATLLRNGATPGQEAAGSVLILVYVALPFALITHLLAFGAQVFVGFMLLLWTTDTGAYLVGRSMGRTPLLPRVSPKKTVEGLAGGVLLAVLVAWLLFQYWPVLSLAQWMACAAVVAVTSTVGDLLESAFKRAAGVKDSGRVLPGHGGILDRFDGFLLALPAMLITVLLLA